MESQEKPCGLESLSSTSGPRDFSTFYNSAQLANLSYDSNCVPYFVNIRPSRSAAVCRVYFASFPPPYGNVNLFYADIDVSETADPSQALAFHYLIPRHTFLGLTLNCKASLAESLLRERMRAGCFGVSDIKADPVSGAILVMLSGRLVHFFDHNWPPALAPSPTNNDAETAQTQLTVLSTGESCIQPAICPANPNLVAFINGQNICVANAITSAVVNLTNVTDPLVFAGSPAYVIQEEFDRYVGFWWRPCRQSQGDDCYTLVYEETDETGVEVVYLPNHGSWSQQMEPHAYPKPGKRNATSTLKMIKFQVDSENKVDQVQALELPWHLFKMFPEHEYLVRAGWTEDGQYFWIQLSNRLQSKMSLFLIPPDSFIDRSAGQIAWKPFVRLHDEEDATYWVETHNCLHLLPSPTPDQVAFIWLSRRTGFSHLYEHVCCLPPPAPVHVDVSADEAVPTADCALAAVSTRSRQLTFGDWEVLGDHIFVDERNKLVLFEGLREHPLWTNVYAVSYAVDAPEVYRLSMDDDLVDGRLSHSIVTFDPESGLCVLESSNPVLLVGHTLFRLAAGKNQPASLKLLAFLKKHAPVTSILPTILTEPSPPSFLSFTFLDPHDAESSPAQPLTFYGMLFTPPIATRPSNGFPTIHLVYGGPGVQFVRGACFRNLILRAQIYCHYGYALLLCDCRGSANRGAKFAGHLKYKMGTVELSDHVMFLRQAAAKTGLIDLNRVAVYGSSYGGYLSLMAAAKHRDTYRAAIAACPVVSWEQYDTAYTERYLGLPSQHPDAYTCGDVMSYVNEFPNFSPYLLIAHGGLDENVHFSHTASLLQRLNYLGKPYELSFYPDSRHRIREDDHLMATILTFLDRTIGPEQTNQPAHTS
uniref:Dipeptidyl peptidase 9 n=2 Tax=Mesocestoides corti TaxID=53468 RepID=A0A5K3FJA9_MESCO